MKYFALKIAVAAVRALAIFARLFASRRADIVLISCQDDEPSSDILDLAAKLKGNPGGPNANPVHGTGREAVHGTGREAVHDPVHGTVHEAVHGTVHNTDAPYIHVISGRMRRSVGGALSFFGKMFKMLRLTANARVVIVDAYCPAVSIPAKRVGQTVVQLWHAPEAIKKFSLQITDTPAGYDSGTAEILCMHGNYDYILCPADATVPLFAEAFGYPREIFVKLGLPCLDRVGLMKRPTAGRPESPERKEKRAAIYEKYPELGGKGERPLTIVYAPTFRDGAASDAEGLARAFERAIGAECGAEGGAAGAPNADRRAGFALVLKMHPLEKEQPSLPAQGHEPEPGGDTGHGRAGDTVRDRAGGPGQWRGGAFTVIRDEDFPLADWYAAANVVVTDYSGVAVEAAAAGIASYYYIYDIDDYKERRGLNIDLRDESVGKYAFADADALAARALDDFARGPSRYDYRALSAFARKYLEVPLEGNTQKLADFIAELICH